MRNTIHFVSDTIKRMFTSPKPYIVFLLLFVIMQLGVGGARTYLAENNQTIHAVELFVFALSSPFLQTVCILGLLFLLGDAPFLKEGMSFLLIRTNRTCWLAGQILSCVLISAIYLVGIATLFMLLFFGQIMFQNEWSAPIRLAAQANIGGAVMKIKVALFITMDVIKKGTPYGMFGRTIVNNLLLYSFLCLVVIFCNIKYTTGVSMFAAIAILGESLIQLYILPYKWLWYLCPCSVVRLADHPITTSGVIYTIMFLSTLCGVLSWLSFRSVKNSDLLRGAYA